MCNHKFIIFTGARCLPALKNVIELNFVVILNHALHPPPPHPSIAFLKLTISPILPLEIEACFLYENPAHPNLFLKLVGKFFNDDG